MVKTFNFDYTFALGVDEVNEILKANMAPLDMEVQYSHKDPDSGAVTSFAGRLSPWTLVSGGGDKLVNFVVPFQAGYISVEGGPPSLDGSWDLTDVSVEVQLNLGWLGPGDSLQGEGSGDATRLVLGLTNTTDKAQAGYVAAIQVFDPDSNLNDLSSALLKEFMGEILVNSRDTLQFVFADINPTPPDVSSWLKPTSWDYYYVAAGDNSAFAFLCMLDGDQLPSQPSFDSSVLSSESNAFLLISQQKFFQHVVLPSMQATFPGAAFDVGCNAEGVACEVSNTKDFTVDKVATSTFTVGVSDQGDGLQTDSAGGGPLKFLFGLAKLPNASYWWKLQTINKLVFQDQSISFAEDADAKPQTGHTIHWYDWVLLAVTGITNVAGLVSAIINLVDGFSSELNTVGMGAINSEIQSAVGKTSVNLAELVQWSKAGQSFTATDAGLSGAFFIWGNLA